MVISKIQRKTSNVKRKETEINWASDGSCQNNGIFFPSLTVDATL